MEKELVNKELGGDLDFNIKLEGEKVRFNFDVESKGAGATLGAFVSLEYFLDKIKDMREGGIEDSLIDMLKLALKK